MIQYDGKIVEESQKRTLHFCINIWSKFSHSHTPPLVLEIKKPCSWMCILYLPIYVFFIALMLVMRYSNWFQLWVLNFRAVTYVHVCCFSIMILSCHMFIQLWISCSTCWRCLFPPICYTNLVRMATDTARTSSQGNSFLSKRGLESLKMAGHTAEYLADLF
jgi:hypothetical protein